MTQKNLWILVVLVGIIFAVGLKFLGIDNNVVPVTEETQKHYSGNYLCDEIAIETLVQGPTGYKYSQKCYEAIENQDITICDEVPKMFGRAFCYSAFIADSKKPAMCSTYLQSYAAENCVVESVSSRDDLVFCKSLSPSSQYGCYLRLAFKSGDPTICSEFSSILTEDGENICYERVAEESGKKEVCDLIDPKDTYTTKDGCYANVVGKNNGTSYSCDSIQSKTERNSCYWYKGVINSDTTACDKIVDGSKEQCYMNVAIAKGDASLCEAGGKHYGVDYMCYEPIAVKNKDLAVCSKSSEPEKCYVKVAAVKNDLSICVLIKDERNKDQCYFYVAQSMSDKNICSKMADDEAQNNCYFKLALSDRDYGTCGYLTEEDNQKDRCMTIVAASREECSTPFSKDKRSISECMELQEQYDEAFLQ